MKELRIFLRAIQFTWNGNDVRMGEEDRGSFHANFWMCCLRWVSVNNILSQFGQCEIECGFADHRQI